MTVRTQDEIVARIKEVEDDDWMGTKRGDLIDALDYEHARPYLKEGVTAEEWGDRGDGTGEAAIKRAKEYLEFAMGKADNHRGISAGRSVEHFETWAWLSGDEKFMKAVTDSDYPNYGAPILKAVAEAIDAKDIWEANTTPELERMAEGLSCDPEGCDEGCGG